MRSAIPFFRSLVAFLALGTALGVLSCSDPVRDAALDASGDSYDPPEITFFSGDTVVVGDSLLLLCGAEDPDGINGYYWDYGLGWIPTGTENSLKLSWATAGSYTVKLMVVDGKGVPSEVQSVVIVVTELPTAVGLVRTIRDTLTLHGRGYDPSAVESFQWDIGGTGFWITTSGEDTTIHLGAQENLNFLAVLKVTGTDGSVSYDRLRATVLLDAPHVDLGAWDGSGWVTSVSAGQSFTLKSRAWDSLGTLAALWWRIDTGSSTKWTAATLPEDTSIVVQLRKPGTFAMMVRAMDDDSTEVQDSLWLTVSYTGVILTAAPSTTTPANRMNQFTVSAESGNYSTLVWDWGDGTLNSTGKALQQTHLYECPTSQDTCQYTLQVWAVDSLGLSGPKLAIQVTTDRMVPDLDLSLDRDTVSIGDTVELTVSASVPVGTIKTRAMRQGSGSWTATTDTVRAFVMPSTVGSVWLYARVVTDVQDTVVDSIRVMVQKDAPVVTAYKDTTVSIDDSVHVWASATDKFGHVVKWELQVGAGSWKVLSQPDTTIVAQSTAGSMTVRLRATDDDGQMDTGAVAVTVVSDPPVVTADGDTTVSLDDSVHVWASATDNFGHVVKWELQVGAGSWKVLSQPDTTITAQSSAGSMTVHFRATDDDGQMDTGAVSVTVVKETPTVNISKDTVVYVNQAVRFAVTASRVYGGWQSFQWDVDGDGTYDSSWTTVPSAFTLSYATADTFTTRLQVVDDDGQVWTYDRVVHVQSGAPTVQIGRDTTLYTNATELSLSVISLKDVKGELTSIQWVYGDGAQETANCTHTASGQGYTYTCGTVWHTYPTTAGVTYTTRLVATDDDGNTVADTLVVTIRSHAPQVVVTPSRSWFIVPSGSIEFSATTSDEDDTAPSTVSWDLDDNGTFESSTAVGESLNRTFSGSLGSRHRVVAKVEDPHGEVNYDTVWISSMEEFTDARDDSVYRKVQIGNQIWMAENLRYVVANGTGSSCYDVDASAQTTCKNGRYYTWITAMSGWPQSSADPSGVQGICPAGWHLPSNPEWQEMLDYVGVTPEVDTTVAAREGILVARRGDPVWSGNSTDQWFSGTNDYGFSATRYPASIANVNSNFMYYWSTTGYTYDGGLTYGPYYMMVNSMISSIQHGATFFASGTGMMTIRCVQN